MQRFNRRRVLQLGGATLALGFKLPGAKAIPYYENTRQH